MYFFDIFIIIFCVTDIFIMLFLSCYCLFAKVIIKSKCDLIYYDNFIVQPFISIHLSGNTLRWNIRFRGSHLFTKLPRFLPS